MKHRKSSSFNFSVPSSFINSIFWTLNLTESFISWQNFNLLLPTRCFSSNFSLNFVLKISNISICMNLLSFLISQVIGQIHKNQFPRNLETSRGKKDKVNILNGCFERLLQNTIRPKLRESPIYERSPSYRLDLIVINWNWWHETICHIQINANCASNHTIYCML